MILGADFLAKVGINLKYDNLTMEWLGRTILIETMKRATSKAAQVASYISNVNEEDLGFDLNSYFVVPNLDAKYEEVKIDNVTLGEYPGKPMHFKVEKGAQPVYHQPYRVPHVHLATF